MKIFLIFIFLVLMLFGDMVDDKAKSFVGEEKYFASKKIIDIMLSDKKNYLDKDGNVNTIKILKILKDNGFLNVALNRPEIIDVVFYTQGSATVLLKVLNNSLNTLGFNFYTTKKAFRYGDSFLWEITMKSEYVIDPVILSQELEKRGCKIVDVVKNSDTNWSYTISTQNAEIASYKILPEVEYKLKKPIKAYWLSFGKNKIRKISIKSYLLNRWHPFVVFYDKDLNIISIVVKDKKVNKIRLRVPNNTKYIYIDDKYTLNNIRSGLRVYAK